MSVKCEVCDKPIAVANDRVFCFGGCGQIVHAKCADVTAAGVTALRENVSIKYVCHDCRKKQTCLNSVMNKCVEMMQKLDDAMKHMEFMFVESEEKIVTKLVEKTEQICNNVLDDFVQKNNKELKLFEKKIVETLSGDLQKNVKKLERNIERLQKTKDPNDVDSNDSIVSGTNFAEIVSGKRAGASTSVLRSGRVLQKPEIAITQFDETSVEIPREKVVPVVNTAINNATNNVREGSPRRISMVKTVRIKPKAVQTNQDTKKEVRGEIDQSFVGIKSVRNAKNGAILVECKSMNEADTLVTQANKTIGEKYEIFIEQPKKPKIKIIGMDKEYEDEDLKEIVLRQNEISAIKHLKIVKVIRVPGRKFNAVSIICEIDSETFQQVMRRGKLNIEWEVCTVVEHVNVLRCFNCCAYGHRSNDCTKNKKCVKCAGDHDVKDCSSDDEKCINCVTLNIERKLNINVDHPAWSRDCPVFKRNMKVSKQFIDYSK